MYFLPNGHDSPTSGVAVGTTREIRMSQRRHVLTGTGVPTHLSRQMPWTSLQPYGVGRFRLTKHAVFDLLRCLMCDILESIRTSTASCSEPIEIVYISKMYNHCSRPCIRSPCTPQGDKLIDDNEWAFLISGKTCNPVNAGENPASDWIDARMWSEVQAISGLPAFQGFAESFAGSLLQEFKVGRGMGVIVRRSENRKILCGMKDCDYESKWVLTDRRELRKIRPTPTPLIPPSSDPKHDDSSSTITWSRRLYPFPGNGKKS